MASRGAFAPPRRDKGKFPLGLPHLAPCNAQKVCEHNVLVERAAALLLISKLKGQIVVLENPFSSIIW